MHDILAYGVPTEYAKFTIEYDHFSFPGAVPRTFIGALVVSGIARPLIWLNARIDRQILGTTTLASRASHKCVLADDTPVRSVLGLFNAFTLVSYATGVKRAFGATTAVWYCIFQAGQFHIIYYASRTLPNMFAFGLSESIPFTPCPVIKAQVGTLALRFLLPLPSNAATRSNKYRRLSLYLLTLAGVIFRSELAVLLATHTLYFYRQRQLSIREDIVPAGIAGLLVGLAMTVSIDSYFWQKFPMWPEFHAFYYNIIDNEASAWGTSPWPYYFTSALPRLFLNPLIIFLCIPASLFAPATQYPSLNLLVPNVAFIALYSFVPHKEARFILYSIPPLTACGALGASYIWNRRTRTVFYRLLSVLLIASTIGTVILSNVLLLPLSSLNYPGAVALNRVHARAHGSKRIISLHMDNLACQTGVTRFLEIPRPATLMVQLPGSPDGAHPTLRSGTSLWLYDKTEDPNRLLDPTFWARFDYVLAEKPELAIGSWEVLETVDGFAGVKVVRPGEAWRGGKASTNARLATRFGGAIAGSWWNTMEMLARQHVTRGWWVEAKMEGKISILKKGSGVRERVATA